MVIENSPPDNEGTVNGIWSIILHHYLPTSEPYIHRAQEYVTKGFTDWWIHQWQLPAEVRRPFLITQCKRQKRENEPKTWLEAENQLRKYIKGMAKKRKRPIMGSRS